MGMVVGVPRALGRLAPTMAGMIRERAGAGPTVVGRVPAMMTATIRSNTTHTASLKLDGRAIASRVAAGTGVGATARGLTMASRDSTTTRRRARNMMRPVPTH